MRRLSGLPITPEVDPDNPMGLGGNAKAPSSSDSNGLVARLERLRIETRGSNISEASEARSEAAPPTPRRSLRLQKKQQRLHGQVCPPVYSHSRRILIPPDPTDSADNTAIKAAPTA